MWTLNQHAPSHPPHIRGGAPPDAARLGESPRRPLRSEGESLALRSAELCGCAAMAGANGLGKICFFYDGEILAESWGKMGKSRKAAAVLIMWLDMVGVFFFRGHFHEPHMAGAVVVNSSLCCHKSGNSSRLPRISIIRVTYFKSTMGMQEWHCSTDVVWHVWMALLQFLSLRYGAFGQWELETRENHKAVQWSYASNTEPPIVHMPPALLLFRRQEWNPKFRCRVNPVPNWVLRLGWWLS